MCCLCGPAPCRATFLFRKGFYSMNWKRVLRIAVCLVLVCTLVVGISPIRAKAVYVPAVTETTIIGVLIYSLLYSSGMIMEPPVDIQALDDAAESFERYIYNNMTFGSEFPGDDDEDKRDKLWEELERTAVKVKDKLHSESWTPKDRLIYNLGTLGVVAACDFLWDCIEKGYFETEVEVPASDGYAYYNGVFLPTFNSITSVYPNYPYHTIFYSRYSNEFFLILSNYQFCCHVPIDSIRNSSHKVDSPKYRRYVISADEFVLDKSGTSYLYSNYDLSTEVNSTHLELIWTNYDYINITDNSIYLASSEPCSSFVEEEAVDPIATVGSIVEGIKSGALKAADIPIPEAVDFTSIFEGIETSGVGAVSNNLANKATEISNGSLSIDDFRESITYTDSSGDDSEDPTEVPGATDGVEDPDDPGDGNEQIPTDATLSNFPVLNFFARLGQLLQDIMNGNLLGIKDFFNPWFESIGQWFQDIRGDISGVRDDLSDIDSSVEDMVDSNSEQNNILEQGFSAVSSVVSGAIANAAGDIVDAVKSTVVPEEDFLTNKVNALCDEFSFADSIVKTGQALHLGLANISTEPPVIYIDLGSARWGYNIGGKVPFVDMRWYAEYKPTADALISAFLWICFVWRMLIHLPGILSGASGVFVLGPVPSTQTSPIGSSIPDELKWRHNPDGSSTPIGSYSGLLKQYHEDYYDNPDWAKAYGRNPSYRTLQEIYTISAEDMRGKYE